GEPKEVLTTAKARSTLRPLGEPAGAARPERNLECRRAALSGAFSRALTQSQRPHLLHCYDVKGLPRTNKAMEGSIRSRKHALSTSEWSQKLEELFVTLWTQCGELRCDGPRTDQRPPSRAALGPHPTRALAASSRRSPSETERAVEDVLFQTPLRTLSSRS